MEKYVQNKKKMHFKHFLIVCGLKKISGNSGYFLSLKTQRVFIRLCIAFLFPC